MVWKCDAIFPLFSSFSSSGGDPESNPDSGPRNMRLDTYTSLKVLEQSRPAPRRRALPAGRDQCARAGAVASRLASEVGVDVDVHGGGAALFRVVLHLGRGKHEQEMKERCRRGRGDGAGEHEKEERRGGLSRKERGGEWGWGENFSSRIRDECEMGVLIRQGQVHMATERCTWRLTVTTKLPV